MIRELFVEVPEPPRKHDVLGEFLKAYGEYLHGERAYDALPIPTATQLREEQP